MCAPNKTKEGNKAFSYLFRTHLVITISAMVSGRLAPCQEWKFFSIKHELMDSIIEVFYHFNKILIATKHIVNNNKLCLSVRQRTGTSCMQQ